MTEDYENFLREVEDAARQEEVRPFSHDEMVACPECLRANPPTRTGCLYCGAALPLSERAATARPRPTLRQPEQWEEGYNVILSERAPATDELLKELAGLLKLEREEAARILESEAALPLARVRSGEEARLIEERLRACGLKALVLSDKDLLMRDENRRRVRAFDFDDVAVMAHAAGGGEVWRAEWPELLLLVTGRLIVRRVETEERRKGRGSETVEAREMTGDVLVLDLYTKARDGGWRLASDSFDFSCLEESKALVAAQNFSTLIGVLRERAPQMELDDSYNRTRRLLASIWPPEERTESRGLRRDRPGRLNVETVMTSNNETQFTRYSRLRHFVKLQRRAMAGIIEDE